MVGARVPEGGDEVALREETCELEQEFGRYGFGD
jgi:hypothetical protein